MAHNGRYCRSKGTGGNADDKNYKCSRIIHLLNRITSALIVAMLLLGAVIRIMNYIVIDKETGLEVTNKVRVIAETTESYMYCRKMADDIFKKADAFYDTEIQSRYDKLIASSMDDFGKDFDPERAGKWSAYCDELKNEISKLNKEHDEMIRIGGDWEDKEYAARVLRLVNFLSVRSENPLRYKEFKLDLWKQMVEYYGCPSLGKYL